MDACTEGQLPWLVDSPFSPMSGATAEDACYTWASLQGAYVIEARPDACVILPEEGSPDEPTSIPVVQVCEATSPTTAIQCTASSPCTMTLTETQWDGGVALIMGAACVIAFALGFNGGFSR